MKYNPENHHRHSIRLKGYDYAQAGAYFVTIVAQGRECLFGSVVDGEVRLSEYGHIVADEWVHTADVRPNVTLDAFVVMPNHIHGIITITGRGTAAPCPYHHATCPYHGGPYPEGRTVWQTDIEFHSHHRPPVQIGKHQTHQRRTRHSRHIGLAT